MMTRPDFDSADGTTSGDPYASAYRRLRLQGTPIPMNDVWIAALVLQHNLRLHDRDRHFNHLPQIVRV